MYVPVQGMIIRFRLSQEPFQGIDILYDLEKGTDMSKLPIRFVERTMDQFLHVQRAWPMAQASRHGTSDRPCCTMTLVARYGRPWHH